MKDVLESITFVPAYPTVFHQHLFFNALHYLYCKQWTTDSYWRCSLWHKKTKLVSICPSIHPYYDTTSHSQPLASYNSHLQTVLFCAICCQLWLRKSLAAHSCSPSSHLKMGLPTGQLQVMSGCTAFLGIWLRGSLCTCPTHCSL